MKTLSVLLLTCGAVQASVVEPSKYFFTTSGVTCKNIKPERVTHLAAGGTHTCVMMESGLPFETDASKYQGPIVKCWGTNLNGAMGYGDTVTRGTIASDMGLGLPFINLHTGQSEETSDLITGELATCYIVNSAEPDSPHIRCWGQLGAKESTKKGDGPNEMGSKLSLVGKNVESLSIGTKNGCYLGSGSAHCWGSSDDGVLGANYNYTSGPGRELQDAWIDPLAVHGSHKFSEISVGDVHACGSMSNRLFCWGCALCDSIMTSSVLGQPKYDMETTGYAISEVEPFNPMPVGHIDQIAAGYDHTCVLQDGQVRCFGMNDVGQLGTFGGGIGTPLPFGSKDSKPIVAKHIASGKWFSCAQLHTEDKFVGIKCWGDNTSNKLGHSGTEAYYGQKELTNPDDWPYVSGIDTIVGDDSNPQVKGPFLGENHACIYYNDQVYCWGDGDRGAIGSGATNSVDNPSTNRVRYNCDASGSPTDYNPSNNTLAIILISSGVSVAFIGLAVLAWFRCRSPKNKDPLLPYATVAGAKSDTALKLPPNVFDIERTVTDLEAMNISFSEMAGALSLLRNTIATTLEEKDSNLVRQARIQEMVQKLSPMNKSHKYAVFVSHSQRENEFARLVAGHIGGHVEGQVFCDLDAGLENLESLERLVEESANLVFILSEKSIASPWCVLEVIFAQREGVKVLPVVLGNFDYEKLKQTAEYLKSL